MTDDSDLMHERINIRGEIEGIHAVLTEREKRYEQRFLDQERAVNAALTAAKEAVDKAEKAQERRLDLLNEFRSQSQDEQTRFATKEFVEAVVERLQKLEVSLGRVQVGAGLFGAAIVTILVRQFAG
ncbi:MAG TPA: hypothetical protein VNG04_00605 [Candidatus Acidoferrum sp.]|nr:hypothetical protein [Candidatus Acidoferrum sp.]